MNETSKAMRRRWREDARGEFPWKSIFTPDAHGIDIGAGPDPVRVGKVMQFDQQHGDANHLTKHFPAGSKDWIHASQSLEHMHNPAVLWDWMTLLKPGGHAIITVPSWELYEGMRWPSRYNPDHKSTWSMSLKGSPAPIHVHVPTFLQPFGEVQTLLMRQLDCNYDYKIGTTFDQTFYEDDNVEPWIEFVLRRL